jgi:hypothetical protein
MDSKTITSAQYITNHAGDNISVKAVIDGVTMSVPMDTANTDYAEIMRQVAAGTLTIQDAD